ncbi:MAG: polyprenyl synthetase family protein [Solobacterium sp.]|nr:polyprenyl synthetase family protein [Solobacterium sp.]
MKIEEMIGGSLDQVVKSRVRDAMEYSLMAGGKRIRPTLLFEVLKGYGKDEEIGIPFARALEMIHTYSLIHDDLPAMDNDDLRRGRPTNHIQFDEATAILAGDGLLTEAFHLCALSKEEPSRVLKAIAILAEMAGPSGMIYGQCLDIGESQQDTFEDIRKVHLYKTGCLLSAPLMIGAVLAGKDDAEAEAWHEVGNLIGLAFQIQDDILDITATAEELGKTNSDSRNNKVTSVSLLGEKEARRLMHDLYEESCARIAQFGGFESAPLITMIRGIEARSR